MIKFEIGDKLRNSQCIVEVVLYKKDLYVIEITSGFFITKSAVFSEGDQLFFAGDRLLEYFHIDTEAGNILYAKD